MSILNKIEFLANNVGISIAALERNCGFSNGSIRRWDINKPSADKLEKVADYFNVSTDYLLGRTDTKRVSIDDELSKIDGDIAAHLDGKEFSEEAKKQILDFIDFVDNKDKKD